MGLSTGFNELMSSNLIGFNWWVFEGVVEVRMF